MSSSRSLSSSLSSLSPSTLVCVYLLLSLHITTSFAAINSIDELKDFFKSTYIRKETGNYKTSVNKKTSFAEGFNPTWGFYRFHHVCLRGGSDGIFSGIDGVKSTAPVGENILRPTEWNDLIGSQFNHPLTTYILEHNEQTPIQLNPVYFANSTLFTNCNRQHSYAFNPSAFMMKLGFFYELGACLLKNFGRQRVFKNDLMLPFRQIFMHQCPDPDSSNWSWGKSTWRVIEKKLQEAMLFQDNRTFVMRRGNEASKEELLCFEDLYMSVRSNKWLQGTQNLISFRREAAYTTGEPEEAKRIQEESVNVGDLPNGQRIYQSYCNRAYSSMIGAGQQPADDIKPTSARIKIYQRTETNAPRSFMNLDGVKSFLQKYTTKSVEIITTTEKQTIQEQIRTFNNFDILVTVHGSHLTNGIYTMKPYTKAVIEIAPFLFDDVYFKNYNELGFAEYVVSTGHLTPRTSPVASNSSAKAFCAFTSYDDFANHACTIETKENAPRVSQSWITCQAALHSRGCDLFVNTTILKAHMDLLLSKTLCRLDSMEKQEVQKYDDADHATDAVSNVAMTTQATGMVSTTPAAPAAPAALAAPPASAAPAALAAPPASAAQPQDQTMPPAPISTVVAAETPVVNADATASSALAPLNGAPATAVTLGTQRLRH